MNIISILVSLCLSAFVFGGTLQWYSFVKQSWEKIQKQKIDQEIQKVLYQYLYKDLQASGYRGVRTKDNSFPLYRQYSDYSPEYRYFQFEYPVYAFVANAETCFGKMPNTACERQYINTEALIIYNVPQNKTQLKQAMSHPSDSLLVNNTAMLQDNSLMLVSDHTQGDLFISTGMDKNLLHHKKRLGKNVSDEFSKLYLESSEIVELQTVAYYLGLPERLKDHKQTINNGRSFAKNAFSLYRDDFLHPAQELVSGITELKFKCAIGEKDKTETIQFVSPIHVKDWRKVTGVQISVTTESGKTWETAISLRNSLP